MSPEIEPPNVRDEPLLPPEPWPIPWRQIGAWIVAVFVVAWALVLLPGVVRGVRVYAGIDSPDESVEIPPYPEDPVLSPKVQDLMARGKAAQRDGQLVRARALFYKAWQEEPRCFSCALHRRIVERLIKEEAIAALDAGGKYLEDLRFADAAAKYREVLALVPDQRASLNVLARDGIEKAKAGAKQSGRPIP